jgi:pyrimidine-nucleoside phosphorylase
MRMTDLILKKRNGGELSAEEIRGMITDYTGGSIPDYQMSAMLMAIFFQGMTDAETLTLTQAMAHSGDMADLSPVGGVTVDKHSTGGVGDKTTLVVAPIVAACGVHVAKMSGRGLGHTGGTVDKLESIPGFRTQLDMKTFLSNTRDIGLCLAGQSGNLTPADKKIYALRDVTATTDSIPLIAASIMSKKLAAGSDCILLDVKTGSGAFMKTADDAVLLAKKMVAIGTNANKPTMALITDMDVPLGRAVGNALEVREAIETLHGKGPQDLRESCLALAAHMLLLAGIASLEECRKKAEDAVGSGAAAEKFAQLVAAQGGDANVLQNPGLLPQAARTREVRAPRGGWVGHMDTQLCGEAAMMTARAAQKKRTPSTMGLESCCIKKRAMPSKAGKSSRCFMPGATRCSTARRKRSCARMKSAIHTARRPKAAHRPGDEGRNRVF